MMGDVCFTLAYDDGGTISSSEEDTGSIALDFGFDVS